MLGADLPERLETAPAALVGRTVAVNGQPFEIIGIFEGIGGGFAIRHGDTDALAILAVAGTAMGAILSMLAVI